MLNEKAKNLETLANRAFQQSAAMFLSAENLAKSFEISTVSDPKSKGPQKEPMISDS